MYDCVVNTVSFSRVFILALAIIQSLCFFVYAALIYTQCLLFSDSFCNCARLIIVCLVIAF